MNSNVRRWTVVPILVIALLAGLILWLGRVSAVSSTTEAIDRDHEPVLVTGADLVALQDAPTDELFVYAYRDDSDTLEQIPFQVDVKDAGTYVPDVGTPLDDDDEVVFMASDLGDQLLDEVEISSRLTISPTWYRIEVRDPLTDNKGWAYVVRSSSLSKTFTETYTTYDSDDKQIVTPYYTVGFASGFPGISYLALNESGVDILDRTKIRVSTLLGTFNEEEIGSLLGIDPLTAIKAGPVRVLATGGVVGYRSTLEQATAATVPISLNAARFSTDFNKDAAGSTFYNANTSAGVTVDGTPDPTVGLDPLSPWWQVSGETGTVVQVADSAGLGGTQTSYYKDDSTVDPDDTGDKRSYGDTGIEVDSPSDTIDYRTTLYFLPPNQENVGSTYEDYHENPLEVTSTALFAASVEVDKTGPTQAQSGEMITYTVTISNTSPAGVPDLILDTVDDSLVGDVASLAAASGCDTLVADEVCSFTYNHTVGTDDPRPLPNTVTVHYHPDGSAGDITDWDDHEVEISASSVDVSKTGPAQSQAGETITYTVTIINTSSTGSPDLILDTITDSLVGDVESVAAASGCDILETGEVCSFTYSYVIEDEDPNPVTNMVTAHYHPEGSVSDVTDSDAHEVMLSGYQVFLPLLMRH